MTTQERREKSRKNRVANRHFQALLARQTRSLRVDRNFYCADAVLFLMKNGYVNGITLTVDGGGLLV